MPSVALEWSSGELDEKGVDGQRWTTAAESYSTWKALLSSSKRKPPDLVIPRPATPKELKAKSDLVKKLPPVPRVPTISRLANSLGLSPEGDLSPEREETKVDQDLEPRDSKAGQPRFFFSGAANEPKLATQIKAGPNQEQVAIIRKEAIPAERMREVIVAETPLQWALAALKQDLDPAQPSPVDVVGGFPTTPVEAPPLPYQASLLYSSGSESSGVDILDLSSGEYIKPKEETTIACSVVRRRSNRVAAAAPADSAHSVPLFGTAPCMQQGNALSIRASQAPAPTQIPVPDEVLCYDNGPAEPPVFVYKPTRFAKEQEDLYEVLSDLQKSDLGTTELWEHSTSGVLPATAWSGIPNTALVRNPLPPAAGICQCYIVRHRGPIIGCSAESFFHLYTEEGPGRADRELLMAQAHRRCSRSEYNMATRPGGLVAQHFEEGFVGLAKSNLLGTKYELLSQGELMPGSGLEYRVLQGVVSYSSTAITLTGDFRKMHVVLPKPAPERTAPANYSQSQELQPQLPADWAKEADRYLHLRSKLPHYNKSEQWYEYFYNRNHNKLPVCGSVKNFQLVLDEDPETPVLTFGKISKDVFVMDYRSPLTAQQAFGICLTAIDSKLCCIV